MIDYATCSKEGSNEEGGHENGINSHCRRQSRQHRFADGNRIREEPVPIIRNWSDPDSPVKAHTNCS